MDKLNIILLGKAGSGKGTQAKILSEKFNLYHISTGDLLRLNLKNNTKEGLKAKTYIEKGILVPDSLIIKLLINEIRANFNIDLDKDYNGIIFDGFPRNGKQAKLLDKMLLKHFSTKINYVIDYSLSDEIATKRIQFRASELERQGLEARKDDKDETAIKQRLEIYNNEVLKIKEFYQQYKIVHLIAIDANQSIEQISDDTLKLMKEKFKKNDFKVLVNHFNILNLFDSSTIIKN